MFKPPRLGTGLVYSSFLFDMIRQDPGLVDFVEIEPETFWVQRVPGRPDFRMSATELNQLRAVPCAKLLHSIGFPVGGSSTPDLNHVALLNRMADELDVPWVSEHLSFNTAMIDGLLTPSGMLLPQVQTVGGVECAAKSTRAYASAVSRPLAIETGVNYFRPNDFELSDGSFIREVVEEADCGILLDLHNLWANERNGRQHALDVIAELPLDRVWEVHVAGGETRHGYWIDGHCGAVPEEVLAMARDVIPSLPNLGAITLEIFPAYLPQLGHEGLRREVDTLRRLFDETPATLPSTIVPRRTNTPSGKPPSVAEWERALTEAILQRPPATAYGKTLIGDPAVALYGELLGEFRASMVATALGLTTRLLLIYLGEDGMRRLLSTFWRRTPPEMSAAAEAVRFGEFLGKEPPGVPLLDEILAFELGAVRATMEQRSQHVRLDCDIRLAIADLVQHRRPAPPGPTRFDFVIDPPIDDTKGIARAQLLH